MKPLTARERRIAAVGLLVLAVALVWLLLIGPLAGGFLDRAAERRDLRAAYQTNARLVAALPAARAAAEAQAKSAPRFAVPAVSETLAIEAVKERLLRVAADEGVAVKAMDDLQAEAAPGEIKMRVDLTLTLNQLIETLRRLENEDAYVVVDYIAVSADRSLAAGRLEPIDVRLELSTAWRPIRGGS
jgi:general secretion pathway protein M